MNAQLLKKVVYVVLILAGLTGSSIFVLRQFLSTGIKLQLATKEASIQDIADQIRAASHDPDTLIAILKDLTPRKATNVIVTLKDLPFMQDPANLIRIFESFAYKANAISVAEQINNIPTQAQQWINQTKKQLNHGQDLIDAALADKKLQVEDLLRNPYIDINAHDNKPGGLTALMHAAWNGDVEIVNLLLNAGADANVLDKFGRTALGFAPYGKFYPLEKSEEVVKLLLDAGAKVNRDARPLTNAALVGSKKIVEMLLNSGANINAQDNEGRTALMGAALLGHRSVVEQLLNQGTDPRIRNKDGQTAADFAREKDHGEIADLIDAAILQFTA